MKKRNIHHTGPLGALLKSGLVSTVDENKKSVDAIEHPKEMPENKQSERFKTQSGMVFTTNELIEINPDECVPWQYANRSTQEMVDIEELKQSIQKNGQMQPGLVRPHPAPSGKLKYEIIFGRKRHLACSQLNKPFLVVVKNIADDKHAALFQYDENKQRSNVSLYSDALNFKKLIDDRVFSSIQELAKSLHISKSTCYDMMAFTKLPLEMVNALPNVHQLSNIMALKIVSLLTKSPTLKNELIAIAPKIGSTITSPISLERALKQSHTHKAVKKPTIVKSESGKKLFTFKIDSKGSQCLVIDKSIQLNEVTEDFCNYIKAYLEKEINAHSGAPE